MFSKWEKALVHLACAASSTDLSDLAEKMEKGKISDDKFGAEFAKAAYDIEVQGAALFLVDQERRYLLTARHVLYDNTSAKREIENLKESAAELTEPKRKLFLKYAAQHVRNKIYKIIFHVPSTDEATDTLVIRDFLVNLGEEAYLTAPYTFSPPDLDLAIISIDQHNSKFGDNLISLGYEPITLDDFNDQILIEGLKVSDISIPFKENIKAEDIRTLLSLQQEKDQLQQEKEKRFKNLMMGISLPFRMEN